MNTAPLNTYAKQHWDWVEAMGWHTVPLMSSMGLVASELGEVAHELLGRNLRPDAGQKAKEELVDVLLRLMDIAVSYGVDLAKETEAQSFHEDILERNAIDRQFYEMMAQYGKWANSSRKEVLPPEFYQAMGALAFHTLILFQILDRYDQEGWESVLVKKMEKNKQRGNKGRLI